MNLRQRFSFPSYVKYVLFTSIYPCFSHDPTESNPLQAGLCTRVNDLPVICPKKDNRLRSFTVTGDLVVVTAQLSPFE